MSSRGENALTRYLRHAPGGTASQPLADGFALSSDDAIMLANNVAHLENEGLRHFVASMNFTGVTVLAAERDAFNGLSNQSIPPDYPNGMTFATRLNGPQHVGDLPWDRRCSARFGPWHMILDGTDALGVATAHAGTENVPRAIHMQTRLAVGTGLTSGRAYFAATTTPDGLALTQGQCLAAGYTDLATGAGEYTIDKTLYPKPPSLSSGATWRCRSSNAAYWSQVRVLPLYLWFGWRFIGGANHYVTNFSAVEQRDATVT